MKIYHTITNTILNVNLEKSNIKSEKALKNHICKNVDNIFPDNIRFIQNAKHITGDEVLTYDNINFIIVPIICSVHK